MKHHATFICVIALAAFVSPAFGQASGTEQGSGMQNGMMQGGGMMQNGGMMQGMPMKGGRMHGMMGMHRMSATVTDVDSATGLIGVNANGMALKLHFPPAALADVKAGDKITLHMAFTKP